VNLAVVILTSNEEENLPACLASLKGLDAEIFVVDSGSTDRTIDIATSAGARILTHSFDNYAAQRNWAQENLPIRSEWVLHLDADERLTPNLVRELNELFNENGDNLEAIDGFLFRKRTFFMGRWIRHGGHYPSYHLRLFRRAKGLCEERLYDQHFIVKGKVAKLNHDYIDVLSSDLNRWTQRHVRWASLEARQALIATETTGQVAPALFGNPIERRRWLKNKLYNRSPLFVRPFIYWMYRYFVRLGFLDGKEGFVFHFLQGFWFRLLVDIEIDQLRRSQRSEVRGRRSDVGKEIPATDLWL
jgi:glycosyltransferase involved in cell wall biosynthesis